METKVLMSWLVIFPTQKNFYLITVFLSLLSRVHPPYYASDLLCFYYSPIWWIIKNNSFLFNTQNARAAAFPLRMSLTHWSQTLILTVIYTQSESWKIDWRGNSFLPCGFANNSSERVFQLKLISFINGRGNLFAEGLEVPEWIKTTCL